MTLLVNPDEAERLTLASTEGKIQLALRNPLDKDDAATRGIRPAALLGVAGDDAAGDAAGVASAAASLCPYRTPMRRPLKSSAATSAHAKSCVRSNS